MTITLLLSLYLGIGIDQTLPYCEEAQYTVAYIQATSKVEKKIEKGQMIIQGKICDKIINKYTSNGYLNHY